jgi:hypothetical protein
MRRSPGSKTPRKGHTMQAYTHFSPPATTHPIIAVDDLVEVLLCANGADRRLYGKLLDMLAADLGVRPARLALSIDNRLRLLIKEILLERGAL